MSRLPPIPDDQMTDRQREVARAIAGGPRGGVRGPFNAFLRSPELADHAQRLGAFLRYETSLPPRLSELAIIITARAWTAQYEWYAHARLAREAGVDEAIISAIAERRQPSFADPDQEAVYAFCNELHQTHDVGDATWAPTIERFGERGAVELIGLCGYYVMVAMVLNATRVGLPEGVSPPLAP